MAPYTITNQTRRYNDLVLHKIVDADGVAGGFVESASNLSQHGTCWLHERAVVYGEAYISEDAQVFGEVYGQAHVLGRSRISGEVYGRACIAGNATVAGEVYGDAQVRGNASIEGEVYGKATVMGNANVIGESIRVGSS